MKVYVIISANALPGKWHEAPKAAVESVQYLNANPNYVGKYQVVAPLSGPNKEYQWLCEFKSLADHEKDSELRRRDPDWAAQWTKIEASTDTENIVSRMLRVME
jgi:hypothetical protein